MPVAKYIYIGMTFGRIPLMLLAMQWSSVCKTFIYYQALFLVVEGSFLVARHDPLRQQYILLANVLNFGLHSFNFYQGAFCVLFTQVCFMVQNGMSQADGDSPKVILFGFSCTAALFSYILLLQVIIQWTGT